MNPHAGEPDFLQPVRSDLGRMQEVLDGLGADDGAFLHHVLGTLLARPTDRWRPGMVLLVGHAVGAADRAALVQFAAAVQIVHAASLTHQATEIGQNNPGERDQLRVLAGDYLYAQAALLTAGLHHFGVMSSLAAAIQTICARELGDPPRVACSATAGMGMFQLSALGAGLLSGCDEHTLVELAHYGRALDRAVDGTVDMDTGEATAQLRAVPDSAARRALIALARTVTDAQRSAVP